MHAIVGTERKRWYARLWGALDPVEVLTEVTSGLTITLVVLLTAGVVLQGGDHPMRVLLVLGLGSTLAAGISPLTCGLVLVSVGLVEIVAAFVLEAL